MYGEAPCCDGLRRGGGTDDDLEEHGDGVEEVWYKCMGCVGLLVLLRDLTFISKIKLSMRFITTSLLCSSSFRSFAVTSSPYKSNSSLLVFLFAIPDFRIEYASFILLCRISPGSLFLLRCFKEVRVGVVVVVAVVVVVEVVVVAALLSEVTGCFVVVSTSSVSLSPALSPCVSDCGVIF